MFPLSSPALLWLHIVHILYAQNSIKIEVLKVMNASTLPNLIIILLFSPSWTFGSIWQCWSFPLWSIFELHPLTSLAVSFSPFLDPLQVTDLRKGKTLPTSLVAAFSKIGQFAVSSSCSSQNEQTEKHNFVLNVCSSFAWNSLADLVWNFCIGLQEIALFFFFLVSICTHCIFHTTLRVIFLNVKLDHVLSLVFHSHKESQRIFMSNRALHSLPLLISHPQFLLLAHSLSTIQALWSHSFFSARKMFCRSSVTAPLQSYWAVPLLYLWLLLAILL